MKLVQLKNCTEKRISIMQVGLRLSPGQIGRVHPSTVSHPAVAPYVGKGLVVISEKTAETKVEPIAPVVPVAPPVVPVVPEIPEASVGVKEEDTSTAGESLRDAFVEAPGITDDNVDSVMSVFTTFEELAAASKGDLIELGVAKSYAKKLCDYAAKQ